MKYYTGALAAFGLIGGIALTGSIPALAAVTSTAPQHSMAPIPERVPSMAPKHGVALLQEALNSTGANLRADGIWGPNTETALRSYQRQHGLQVTGRLDTATRQALDPIG